MARPMKVCLPSTIEVRQLCKRVMGLINPHQQRRADALILYGMGLGAVEIADAQGVHPNTIYTDLHAFEQAGLAAVEQLQTGGAPMRITAAQVTALLQLADQSPSVVGLAYGRWSLRKLSTYLVKKHVVKSIGHERLRQLLKKRSALSARPAQVDQSRPATPSDFGSDPLDFQAFARRGPSVVFRCQADCGQSLRRSALHLG